MKYWAPDNEIGEKEEAQVKSRLKVSSPQSTRGR